MKKNSIILLILVVFCVLISTLVLAETVAPNANATAPPNNHNITSSGNEPLTIYTIQINATADDGSSGLANVSLMINDTYNMTNSSGLINGSGYIFTVTFPSINATYNWSIRACDVDGNCNSTANRSLSTWYQDTVFPNVSLGTPANLTNLSSFFSVNPNAVNFTGNASDIVGLANVSLMIDGARNGTNSSGLVNGSYTFAFTFSQKNATYNWSIESCDTSGHCNTTVNKTIYTWYWADQILPNVTLSGPANDTDIEDYIYQMTFNATAADETKLSNVTLYINGVRNITNSSGLVNGSYSLLLAFPRSNSTYLWGFETCDTTGNCNITGNRTLTTVFADNISPTLNFNSSNTTVKIGERFGINANFTEGSMPLNNLTCLLSINGATVNYSNATDGSWCNLSYLVSSSDYPNITAVLNVSDWQGNVFSNTYIVDLNLLCGDTITTNFTLQENLNCGGANGLVIGANHLALNLNGYKINGSGAYSGIVIAGRHNVSVNGGTVFGFNKGVIVSGTSMSNNVSLNILNTTVGIALETPNNNIITCNINYSSRWGINASNASSVWNLTSRNTLVNSNVSFNGSIVFTNSSGILDLTNSYITLNGTFINLTGVLNSLEIVKTTATVNISTDVNLPSASSNLSIYLNNTVAMVVSASNVTLTSTPSGYTAMNGVDIVVDAETRQNLTWAYLTIKYDETVRLAQDFRESSLRIYYYNTSSSAWELEAVQGLDEDNNLVWANITHFSLFGIFGTKLPTSSATGAGGSGSSRDEEVLVCSEDWICESWSACANALQTRKCFDAKSCGTSQNKPAESKACDAQQPVTAPVTEPANDEQPAQETTGEDKSKVREAIAGKATAFGDNTSGSNTTFYVIVGIAVLAIIALVVFFLIKRK